MLRTEINLPILTEHQHQAILACDYITKFAVMITMPNRTTLQTKVRAITINQIRTQTAWLTSYMVQHIGYGNGSAPTCATSKPTRLSTLIAITDREHKCVIHRARLLSCSPEPYHIQMCPRRSIVVNGERIFKYVSVSELVHILRYCFGNIKSNC